MDTKCPTCNQYIKGNYCPICGLPKVICKWELILGNGHGSGWHTVTHSRPELKKTDGYQWCNKCLTLNPCGAKYCRSCGKKMHEWVDLGLSVLWSTESMEGKYMWMDDVAYPQDMNNPHLKDYQGNGVDVASKKWGDMWRMPTKEECEELIKKCTWERVVIPVMIDSRIRIHTNRHISAQTAFKVTGPNGNHITIPTNSNHPFVYNKLNCVGWLWTSTPKEERGDRAWAFIFGKNFPGEFHDEKEINSLWLSTPMDKTTFGSIYLFPTKKNSGWGIRPVADKKWKGKL